MSTANQPNDSNTASNTDLDTTNPPQTLLPIPIPPLSTLPTLLTNTTKALLPSEQHRTVLKTTITNHPYLTTLLLTQLIFTSIPITLFLAGIAVTASLAASVFACLALLVLGPVLIFASLLGLWAWGFGWVMWVVGGWVWRVLEGKEGDADGVVKGGWEDETDVESKDKDKGLVVEEKEVT